MRFISGARLHLLDFPDDDKTQEQLRTHSTIKMTLTIQEEVLDSRLGGSVPRVLRFFLRILRDNLGGTSD
jgi:hypothetical protein